MKTEWRVENGEWRVISRKMRDSFSALKKFSIFNSELSIQKGFVALSTVLMISAVVLVIVVSSAYLGISEMITSFSLVSAESNLALVEGCTEDYLLKISNNPTFSGGNISRPEGTCTVVINQSAPAWDITVSSTNTAYTRKVRAQITQRTFGNFITSWREN
jgi:hypothetical protein